MTLHDIRARVLPLDALTRGLAKETLLVAESNNPRLNRKVSNWLVAMHQPGRPPSQICYFGLVPSVVKCGTVLTNRLP
jgi:hypothetical protein